MDHQQEASSKIWKPSVEVTSSQLPYPGAAPSAGDRPQLAQLYTKTWLQHKSFNDDSNQKAIRSYNQRVLKATQSFNATPKPFRSSASIDRADQSIEFDKRDPSTPTQRLLSLATHSYNSKPIKTADDEMAPKLVHNQYNSPIDLYSMNNIRKTIEAHTELIAPGVKGINFMKADTPVNKQSEVYKLIMEEEMQQQGRQRAQSQPPPPSQEPASAHLSPISDRPSHLPSSMVDSSNHQQAASTSYSSSAASSASLQQQAKRAGCPPCCECGHYIVGPFAKIQNKFVHPHCFNCTTCGTSLKNTGYFTVNDKLYCQIHAKSVADMLRIRYDFEASQAAKARHSDTHQHQPQPQVSQSGQQQQQSRAQGSNRSESFANPSATISTMFADRSRLASQIENNERNEVNWSWRPAQTSELSSDFSASTSAVASSVRERASITQSRMSQHHQQGRGIVVSNGSNATFGPSDNRLPVCVSCHVQIHGAYVLANKSTWCKPCSQTNFVCGSCRRSLLDVGFIEAGEGGPQMSRPSYFCEHCFDTYYAPTCFKCNMGIKGDCLNALGKKWHPSCFVCGHCRHPFGNSSFYLEDNVPYCERDWNLLFTTKCYSCALPIEASDKWIEALDRNYHSNCFKCTACGINLEGSTFYCKSGKPYCRSHAR